MHLPRGLSPALFLAAAVGCAPPEAGPAASQRAAIAGGVPTRGDPAVYLLDVRSNTGIETSCSATLIAPSTLLTAAHCIDPVNVGGTQLTLTATNVPTRAEVQPGVNTVAVVATRLHPEWNAAAGLSADLALLALATPSTEAPVRWNFESLAGLGGSPVRAVGYGADGPDGGTGTKRTAALTIRQLTAERIVLGDLATRGLCHGDSGGPTLWTAPDGGEVLIGVHSYTLSDACNDGADMRVDAFAPFLQAWLAEREDTCGPDHVCSQAPCPAPDPDCVPLGAPCASAFACVSRRCEPDAQHPEPYCTRACSTAADCGAGLECEAGRCLRPQRPLVPAGEACVPGTSLCEPPTRCAAVGAEARCLSPCGGALECPASAQCEAVPGQGFSACVPLKVEVPVGRFVGPAAGCTQGPGLVPLLLGALWVGRRRAVRAATAPRNC